MELYGVKSLTLNNNQVMGTISEQIVLILGLEQLQLLENHINNTVLYQISYNTKFINLGKLRLIFISLNNDIYFN